MPKIPGPASQQHPNIQVASVSLAPRHTFSKPVRPAIRLLAGLGVEHDAHAGETVRHRYRVKQDSTQPNLCQVHLIHEELFAELRLAGFIIGPGDLGENVVSRGLDLLSLPVETQLRIGSDAVVQLTGLRTPCVQLDRFQPGLMRAMKAVDKDGRQRPRCGVMGIVIASGNVIAGDAIDVRMPPEPHRRMQCV